MKVGFYFCVCAYGYFKRIRLKFCFYFSGVVKYHIKQKSVLKTIIHDLS